MSDVNVGEPRYSASGRYRYWTEEEDALVRDLWGKESAENIGKRFGRKKDEVMGRAHRLKLPKLPGMPIKKGMRHEWTAEQDARLRRMWKEGILLVRMSEEFKRSTGSVHWRASQLGLKPRELRSKAYQGQRGGNAVMDKILLKRAEMAGAEPAPKPTRITEETYNGPRVSLVDLAPHGCRWPFGDPHDPDFGYCGEQDDGKSKYCEAHHKRAVVATVRLGA